MKQITMDTLLETNSRKYYFQNNQKKTKSRFECRFPYLGETTWALPLASAKHTNFIYVTLFIDRPQILWVVEEQFCYIMIQQMSALDGWAASQWAPDQLCRVPKDWPTEMGRTPQSTITRRPTQNSCEWASAALPSRACSSQPFFTSMIPGNLQSSFLPSHSLPCRTKPPFCCSQQIAWGICIINAAHITKWIHTISQHSKLFRT